MSIFSVCADLYLLTKSAISQSTALRFMIFSYKYQNAVLRRDSNRSMLDARKEDPRPELKPLKPHRNKIQNLPDHMQNMHFYDNTQ